MYSVRACLYACVCVHGALNFTESVKSLLPRKHYNLFMFHLQTPEWDEERVPCVGFP